MAEPLPSEEKAALYVLGELAPADHRDFEAQLAASTELRALVRELEDGALALATTAPTNTPPDSVWENIQQSLAEENQRPKIISFLSAICRNGWAAAAACLIGWILYALSIDQPTPNQTSENAASATTEQHRAVAIVESADPQKTNSLPQTSSDQNREAAILRDQLVGLQRQVTQLSQSVTQQQALLNESNRIKFLRLAPSGPAGPAALPRPLSPGLQRALFLAMAKELGWLPATNEAARARQPIPHFLAESTNQFNVEFVDLRNGAQSANPAQPQSEPHLQALENTSPTSQFPAPAVIPAFVSGESVFAAIDSSITPVGSQITVLSGTGDVIGSAILGDDPLVFATHSVPRMFGGSSLIVTATLSGQSTTFEVVVSPQQ